MHSKYLRPEHGALMANSVRAVIALADHLGKDPGWLAKRVARDNVLALIWETAVAGAGRETMDALLRGKE